MLRWQGLGWLNRLGHCLWKAEGICVDGSCISKAKTPKSSVFLLHFENLLFVALSYCDVSAGLAYFTAVPGNGKVCWGEGKTTQDLIVGGEMGTSCLEIPNSDHKGMCFPRQAESAHAWRGGELHPRCCSVLLFLFAEKRAERQQS